jgi:heme-degrading monooxygenase HmoA
MIVRVWHGWTSVENADRYEDLIRSRIFPGIVERRIKGFERVELYRRPLGDEVEFITVMRFASLDAVKAFAGQDWETSVVPPAAQAVLSRFDDKALHYEVRAEGSAIGGTRDGLGTRPPS